MNALKYLLVIGTVLFHGLIFADQLNLDGIDANDFVVNAAKDNNTIMSNYNRSDHNEQLVKNSSNTMSLEINDVLAEGEITIQDSLTSNSDGEYSTIGVIAPSVRPTQTIGNSITNTNVISITNSEVQQE